MTKKEFIEKLEAELKDETYSTVTQVMTYYEEIIADLMEDGYSEEDAISKLGSIQETVANVKGNEEIIEIKKMKTTTSACEYFINIRFSSLGFFNGCLVMLVVGSIYFNLVCSYHNSCVRTGWLYEFYCWDFWFICTVYRIRLFRNYTIRCERNIWSCWTYWDRPNLSSIRNNSCIF